MGYEIQLQTLIKMAQKKENLRKGKLLVYLKGESGK